MSGRDVQQDSALLEFLKQQQKQHEDQQALLMGMLEQQKLTFEAHKSEMSALLGQQQTVTGGVVPKLPKPLLQRLTAEDDVEHFLAVFERVAKQQKWPEEVWATQPGGAAHWEGHGSVCRAPRGGSE